jgi:hypothetical protein
VVVVPCSMTIINDSKFSHGARTLLHKTSASYDSKFGSKITFYEISIYIVNHI